MRVCVIITTYKRPAMLGELLEALAPQLAGDRAEAIVIDNCPDASASDVAGAFAAVVRYVHEPQAGVVRARNRGLREAESDYVIFLDDDEVPAPGWLDAFLSQADGTTEMSFGRIAPRIMGSCSADLLSPIRRLFTREFGQPTGLDITSFWAHLGTGNAMFRKTGVLLRPEPFDMRFNERGGEDIWLIKGLVGEGKRLVWNREALVEELVPAERTTLPFLKARRFDQGRARCTFVHGDGGLAGKLRAALWMGVGLIQFGIYAPAALLARLAARSRVADFECRAAGGLGKLLWWRK